MPKNRPPHGNAEGTLDSKCRATVPTRMRPMFDGIEQELVLWEPSGVKQPYLLLTSEDYFDEIVAREYDRAAPEDRENLIHDVWGHMDYIELDSAARFVIPDKYFPKAGFGKGEKIFFMANGTYIEIWPLAVWRHTENERRGDHSVMVHTPSPSQRVEEAIRRTADEDRGPDDA